MMIKQSLICLSILGFGVSGIAQAETVPYYAVHHKSKWEKIAEKEAKKDIRSLKRYLFKRCGIGKERMKQSNNIT